MPVKFIALLSGVALGACSVIGVRSGTEEAAYTVIETLGTDPGTDIRPAGPAIEIRRYEPALAADVMVDGDEIGARSAGFRILADYIFGNNRPRSSIAMTAPVGQSRGEPIAMTAPVGQEVLDGGSRWKIRFTMPAAYRRSTLPAPVDTRIEIVELPAQTMAVLRFSGTATVERVADHRTQLLARLPATNWAVDGAPVAMFFDPPWTIPALRRNEIGVPVRPRG